MFSALATLGSFAIPKLISFVSKKVAHTPLGQTVSKIINNDHVKNFASETVKNIKEEMENRPTSL